ncbi:hypothetical protein [Xylanimonas sp. McL0601]|uniref:hypothetical protein n=1 Tax=Xylanimonas sp. McL0601 TaxID=3414739 RepID=UPI003CF15961
MDADRARELPVLELRIHGIANTPPARMLELPADEVMLADGDGLGSFWIPTPAAEARDRALPPGHLHHIPPGVRREAYSWGAMARTSALPFGGLLGSVAHAALRVLWAAVVPFGIANAAYWARAVPLDDAEEAETKARPEATAAAVRLFALALTLLVTAAFTTAAVATLGTACMSVAKPAGPGSQVDVCARVPSQLDALAQLPLGVRAGVLTLVPVAVMVALTLVARSAQVRFDERVSVTRAGGGGRGKRGPLLYRSGFWARRPSGPTALWAHLGAALALVAVLLSWTDQRTGLQTGLLFAGGVVLLMAAVVVALRADDDGVEMTPVRWKGPLAALVLAGGLALWVAAWIVSATQPVQTVEPRWVGMEVAPSVLGTLLVGIAVTGLVWRHHRRAWQVASWAFVPLTATGCVVTLALSRRLVDDAGEGNLVSSLPQWTTTTLVAVAALVLVVPAVVSFVADRRYTRPYDGWNGSGPGVFLLVSAALGATYSSLLVLGVQWWLRGGQATAAETPVSPPPGVTEVWRVTPALDSVTVPSAYTEFGVAAFAIVGIFLLQVLVIAWPSVRELVGSTTRWIAMSPGTVGDRTGPTAWAYLDVEANEWVRRAESGDDVLVRPRVPGKSQEGTPPDGAAVDGAATAGATKSGAKPRGTIKHELSLVARRVQRARHVAALAHRVETALGVAAVACFAAFAASIPLRVDDDAVAGIWPIPGRLQDLAVVAVGWVAVTVLVSALRNSSNVLTRPFDVLWDLMCFLPRSAHPLGPASYAERAVPELRARVDAWLHAADVPADGDGRLTTRTEVASRRTVVLSAHSMGATVAAAVVLIRAGNPAVLLSEVGEIHEPLQADDRVRQSTTAPLERSDGCVGLLTYGCQLRPYFGRFFPELLGERALGIPVCTGAAWKGDPWRRQLPGAAERLVADVDAAQKAVAHAPAEARLATSPPSWWTDLRRRGDARARLASARHALRFDRWYRRRLETADGAAQPRAVAAAQPRARDVGRLVDVLTPPGASGPTWVNLWRRTDLIGFPVLGYEPDNGVDRGVEEVDRGAYLFKIAAHSDYPRARAYQEGLATVIAQLGGPGRIGGWQHLTSSGSTTPPTPA